jgi:hypothetical protein
MAKNPLKNWEIEEWFEMHALIYLKDYQHLTVFQYLDSCKSNLLPYILKEYNLEDLTHKLNSTIIKLR